jgi:hypothetical protein
VADSCTIEEVEDDPEEEQMVRKTHLLHTAVFLLSICFLFVSILIIFIIYCILSHRQERREGGGRGEGESGVGGGGGGVGGGVNARLCRRQQQQHKRSISATHRGPWLTVVPFVPLKRLRMILKRNNRFVNVWVFGILASCVCVLGGVGLRKSVRGRGVGGW